MEFFLYLFPLTLALLLWRLRGRGWPGLLGALAWALLCGILCLLMARLLAFSQVILSTLVLGLFFARRDWFGVGKWLGTVWVVAFTLAFAVLLPVGTNYLGSLRTNVFPMLYPLDNDYYIAHISSVISNIRAALSGARWLGPADPALLLTEDGFPRVPNMDSDHLLTNLICSWGWLPFLAVVGAFAAFFLWMLWKTIRLRQTLGRAVCLGGPDGPGGPGGLQPAPEPGCPPLRRLLPPGGGQYRHGAEHVFHRPHALRLPGRGHAGGTAGGAAADRPRRVVD